MNCNILLTSVGRRGYLVDYFKDALNGRGKVHAMNSDPNASGLFFADHTCISPPINDDGYITFLYDYCKNNQIRILLSLFDLDLPKLANSKHIFREIGTEVIISSSEVIDICNDKWKSQTFLRSAGLPTLPTWLSLDDIISDEANFETFFPLVIKPRRGMGSIGLQIAEYPDELKVLCDICKRTIRHSYLSTTKTDDFENDIIIQKKVSGEEYGLDIINDLNGVYKTTVVRRKIAMRAGETESAEIIKHPQLEETGYNISKHLQHTGILDIDLIWHDDEPYVLDLNARFGGGYPFSHMSGINLPAAIINWVMEPGVNQDFFNIRYGEQYSKFLGIIKNILV